MFSPSDSYSVWLLLTCSLIVLAIAIKDRLTDSPIVTKVSKCMLTIKWHCVKDHNAAITVLSVDTGWNVLNEQLKYVFIPVTVLNTRNAKLGWGLTLSNYWTLLTISFNEVQKVLDLSQRLHWLQGGQSALSQQRVHTGVILQGRQKYVEYHISTVFDWMKKRDEQQYDVRIKLKQSFMFF